MPAEIVAFPCLKDNICVLVHDPATGATAAVDVPDAKPITDRLEALGWRLTDILITHKHSDHIAGVETLKNATGARVIAPYDESDVIPAVDLKITDGDKVKIGSLLFDVIATPGHTLGHVAYHEPRERLLFVGDTLFALGCGRVFEGSMAQMWASLSKIAALPDDTLIWFGHEYTQANARFAMKVDPDNMELRRRAEEIGRTRADNRLSAPTTVGLEKATNPFLRVDDRAIRTAIGMEVEPEEIVFGALREMKNRF